MKLDVGLPGRLYEHGSMLLRRNELAPVASDCVWFGSVRSNHRAMTAKLSQVSMELTGAIRSDSFLQKLTPGKLESRGD